MSPRGMAKDLDTDVTAFLEPALETPGPNDGDREVLGLDVIATEDRPARWLSCGAL